MSAPPVGRTGNVRPTPVRRPADDTVADERFRRLGPMSDPEPSTQEMSPQYDPAEVEPRWAREWIDRGFFRAEVPSDREPYAS